ncbi:MAG: MarR family transcriptional regulator [Pigmentiphaga sp.]|nr:MarR family transcriptional regulator [Pigmentiphaga sp.]
MPNATNKRQPLNLQVDYVTITLDVVNERMKAQASEQYQRECGVNLREVRLLRFIGNEPGLTLTRLIEISHLEKTLASKAITALVRRGLVLRSVGPTDARQICLYLTDEGVAVVMNAERIGRAALKAFREALSDEEHAIFETCLHKLARAADQISSLPPLPAQTPVKSASRATKRARSGKAA